VWRILTALAALLLAGCMARPVTPEGKARELVELYNAAFVRGPAPILKRTGLCIMRPDGFCEPEHTDDPVSVYNAAP
jgi:hypothetical protein